MNKNNLTIYIATILLLCLQGCADKNKEVCRQAVNTIIFDYNQSIENYDIKDLLTTYSSIIPLETTEDCVVAGIEKIEIVNDTIYIFDDIARTIYKFDKKGKYINKLFAPGHGPGEYVKITDMTVTDTSIIIIDTYSQKQIEYKQDMKTVISEKRVLDKVWAMAIFKLSNSLFYLNDYGNSNGNKFRLFSTDNRSEEFNKFLAFEEKPIALGIGDYQQHYAINGNQALVIYNGCDVIYRIDGDSVYVEYNVLFENDRVRYKNGDVSNVYNDNVAGSIFGMSSINESDKYLFFDVDVIGDKDYSCIYNKESKEIIIYNRIAINSLLDNEQIRIQRVINNQIIEWREAPSLLMQRKYLYAEQEFRNKEYEQQLKSVIDNITEDDNPILFIYNLK